MINFIDGTGLRLDDSWKLEEKINKSEQVGWVERSDTHRFSAIAAHAMFFLPRLFIFWPMMGIAALNPSYESGNA